MSSSARSTGSGRVRQPRSSSAPIPASDGDPDLARYEWGYQWGDELDALVSDAARAAVDRNGFTLGSYAALTAA